MNDVVSKYNERNAKLKDGGEGLYAKERSDFFHTCIGEKRCKVLDLGANHGSFTKHFTDEYDVTAVDFDRKSLALLKERLPAQTIEYDLNQDIRNLSSSKWDAVIMSEVLEHLFWPEEKVSQIATLIRDDGVFVGTVPNGFSLINRIRYVLNRPGGTTMAEPTHVTHFSARRLRKALERSFEHVRIIPIGKAQHRLLAQLSPSLFGFMLAFECRKPKRGTTIT